MFLLYSLFEGTEGSYVHLLLRSGARYQIHKRKKQPRVHTKHYTLLLDCLWDRNLPTDLPVHPFISSPFKYRTCPSLPSDKLHPSLFFKCSCKLPNLLFGDSPLCSSSRKTAHQTQQQPTLTALQTPAGPVKCPCASLQATAST